ncbi:hypothetical protein PHMEG_00020216 [Phytophthora megakarya]|uniref:Uncharacterized protein n=1 Tax=Phytophthora megakarya TaxID=4795 RepID=A0A225VR68_9STRA|nr:hypothetical protein PHMEG_00020216 [Phytophthora megakarya]
MTAALDRVERREKTGELKVVPCPKAIKDYHQFMDGVDSHDQLRLQRYSAQRAITYRNYNKSLSLGLVDFAITNAFIVHRAFCKKKKIKALTHVQYMCRLHIELIALTAGDMFEANTFQAAVDVIPDMDEVQQERQTRRNREGYKNEQIDERVQKNCKVCAMRTEGKCGTTTTFYCNGCDSIYLRMKPKCSDDNTVMIYQGIWHTVYKNSKDIPAEMKGKFRVCAPPRTTHSPEKPPYKLRHVESE